MNDETGEDSLGNMEIRCLRKAQFQEGEDMRMLKKKKKKATYVPWKTLSTGTSPFLPSVLPCVHKKKLLNTSKFSSK